MNIKDVTRYFAYLDQLRAIGIVNMFEAAPYLESKDVNIELARKILISWIATFGDGKTSPTERAHRSDLVQKPTLGSNQGHP
jgi:hypothetical protein